MEMVASVDLKKLGVKAGSRFTTDAVNARLLQRFRKAVPAEPRAEPKAEPSVLETESTSFRGGRNRYKRRDMLAAD